MIKDVDLLRSAHSHKKVLVVCEDCQSERFIQYRDAIKQNIRNGKNLCKKCCLLGSNNWRYNKSPSNKGVKNPEHSRRMSGKNNHRWKQPEDRKSTLDRLIRTCKKYLNWRKRVFRRDKYLCVSCGYDKGHILEADHIVPLSFLIKKFKIKDIDKAKSCRKLWETSNGRTLCKICHEKTDTWGSKAKLWKKLI